MRNDFPGKRGEGKMLLQFSNRIHQSQNHGIGMDFEYNRRFNSLMGVSVYLPDYHEKFSSCKKLFYKIYECSGNLWMMTQSILFIVTIGMRYDDIGVICTSGGAALFILQIPVKLRVYKWFEEDFKNMVNNILETSVVLTQNPVNDKSFPLMYEKFYKKIKFITPVKSFVEFTGLTSLMVFYLIKGVYFEKPEERTLPAPCWTPYDYHETGLYVFSLVMENFSCAGALLRNTAMDMLYCAIIMSLSLQLTYSKKLLKMILQEHEKNNSQDFNVIEKDENHLEKLKRDLKWWTNVHQRILRSVMTIQKISVPYLGYLYFVMMSEFFLVGTVSISTTSWHIVQKCLIITIILLNIFQLYVISTIGDGLTEDALAVTDAGFDITLLSSCSFIRKNFLFTTMRGKSPVLLKAANISPLSAHTFGKLARITFSYFVTMLQVRQERANMNIQYLN